MEPDQSAHAWPSASPHTTTIKMEPGNETMSRAPSTPRASAPAPDSDIKPTTASQLDAPGPADHPASETSYLERLVDNTVPEVLEEGVAVGLRLLDRLVEALDSHPCPDADAWLTSIREIRERAKPTRTVVGVVGNTGAGKSSVINALLDEERLLPTNCIRACTASPTEISYNYSEDPGERYRAEIEFISTQDWVRELEILFSDLLDSNGEVSRESSNNDSDAGIAYAKLKAVYPAKTKDMLARTTPNDLANEPAVRGVLGSVKNLKDESAQNLYRRLQHYVDSREKSTGAEHKKRDLPMEYWPLIKVVRIYTKADALSTGAVLVDLPGVQDSNAARAAVAANYMKSCTGLWIVAPITRAVDDKTAKTLLGNTFKRQLKYDGTYSAVSFICSKTDDISITEAADSLGIEEEISGSWDRSEDLEKKKKLLQGRIAKLKEEKAALGDKLDEYEAEYDIWDDLQAQLSSGKPVYAPSGVPKKRKRPARPLQSRKNRKSLDSDDDDNDEDSDDLSDFDVSDKENSQPEENRSPLTEKEIDEKLASIKAQRKQIRGDRRALDIQIADIRQEISSVQAERDETLAKLRAICIKGRNNYSRGAIKQDFAMGIKELDQENAAEEDDTTFNPDQDIRDYDEVARNLPVFCVSSRAYQKLRGRLLKDNFRSDGFLSPEDTEVPQLQEHAKKLTEARRASHCRQLLNDLAQLANSMKLWSANDGTMSHLTDGEKRREELHLRKLLDDLEKGFETSVKSAVTLLEQTLDEHIYKTFDAFIPFAIDAAVDTAAGWGAHRDMGGLFWSTYKATVRRNGVYAGAAGLRDFNQELFEPISRNLANEWELAFQRRLPAVLSQFSNEAKARLLQFKQDAETRARQRLTNPAGLLTLSNQILIHMRSLEALPATLFAAATDIQREASRQFTPVICEAMAQVYGFCANETGTGQYARMKAAMTEHVARARHVMFHEATDMVKTQLQAMCRALKKNMTEATENIYDSVFRDYMSVLVGTTVERRDRISRDELEMRKRVKRALLRGDLLFAPVLGESAVADLEDTDDTTSTPQVHAEETEDNPAVDSPVKSEFQDKPLTNVPEIDTRASNETASIKPEVREEADEMMQSLIREQSPQQNEESESETDLFPDIMDILAERYPYES
ncbi:Dynamin family-domain-containing protein [Biscogniauxia sp. FL1348]|nr:Dynamin family-domain-containing protein [Biscogniauxia sp. FL1348]